MLPSVCAPHAVDWNELLGGPLSTSFLCFKHSGNISCCIYLGEFQYSSFDATIDETMSMVAGFVADKRRVVLMLGDEGFMRRVICGTRVADASL